MEVGGAFASLRVRSYPTSRESECWACSRGRIAAFMLNHTHTVLQAEGFASCGGRPDSAGTFSSCLQAVAETCLPRGGATFPASGSFP